MMRVGVLSRQDPYDRMTFSGTSHSMVRQLEKYFDVIWIDPSTKWTNRLSRLYHRGTSGKFVLNLNPFWVSHLISDHLNRQVEKEQIDILFNVGMSGPMVGYKAKAKVITFADATMKQMIAHYYNISPDRRHAVHRNEAMEKIAFDRSDIVMTTSDWCSQSVIQDYSIEPDKVRRVMVGANMTITPETKSAPSGKDIHLLFVGIDPVRKGFPIAVDTVAQLNRRDPKRHYILDVVGLSEAEGIEGDDIVFHGLLDKNKPDQEDKLREFYRKSDLFILPTRMDTIGIVFLEAASYGLPILTCRTGGVPEYVIDGEMGYCLDLDADGTAFADKAMELIDHPDKYEYISQRAVERIKLEFNWNRWGEQVADIIRGLSCQ